MSIDNVERAMKLFSLASLALLAGLSAGGAAHAASYHYTDHWDYVRKPALSAAEFDGRLQADAASCDAVVGPAHGTPTAGYRSCMLQHGWKFLSVTRVRVSTPSDSSFSSDVRLKPGHFIDRDSGMDCENIGGASVCEPPSGTVRYYDAEQGLNCTRSGLVSVCSNM
jgi:hypothetical protein